MKFVAVIPTYNEAENLPKLISALLSLPLDICLLIVDDNSPDGSGAIAEKLAQASPNKILVLNRPGKFGLRTAYIQGFRRAFELDADAIIQMDADFSHDPGVILEMARSVDAFDLVIGSRYIQGGAVDREWPWWRKRLSAFGNHYARAILGFPLQDVTTGYRMWKVEALKKMPLERIRANGYSFLIEMAYIAYLSRLRITEVPIYFANRQAGKSKMNFKIQLEAALRIWEIRWRYRDLKTGR